jgi:hypothetical protein
MAFKFNPTTGELDLTGSSSLGILANPFPSTGLYMYSSDGTKLWLMTLDATGAWVATDVTPATGTAGTPMGLLLSLTYSS